MTDWETYCSKCNDMRDKLSRVMAEFSDYKNGHPCEVIRLQNKIAELEHKLAGRKILTHSDKCWSFGPKHWGCAVSTITFQSTELAALREMLNVQDAEIDRLKKELSCYGESAIARVPENAR